MNYRQALAWLYGLQRFGIKLGLENAHRLTGELTGSGLQTAAPWGFKVIHVAGTNGKGSVCAMIDAIARAGGHRTGLFTSPHLVSFRERIQLDGVMIPEHAAATGLTTIRDLVRDWEPHPTFFEVTTALALDYFARSGAEIVVLETGLGGRLDATNAVASNVSVLTPIDFDHQQWLGTSLEEIATEKAGIIKSRIPVVSAKQSPPAENVIRRRAADCAAPLEFVTMPYGGSNVVLPGGHQKQNAALAIAALRALGLPVAQTAIDQGLATVKWPARFQFVDERTVIDGAHNPAAAGVLVDTWRESFANKRATLILAILSDKDLRAICEVLAPIADHVVLPKIRSERAVSPDELAAVLNSITPKVPHSITPSIAAALAQARSRPNPILLTGSLHFAGEALAHLRGEPAAFEECEQ